VLRGPTEGKLDAHEVDLARMRMRGAANVEYIVSEGRMGDSPILDRIGSGMSTEAG